MALGGFNAGTWDATIPAGSESVGLGDDRLRSVKTTLQQALDSEHVWPSGGGIVGQHRAGSARAFYGLQSQLSSSSASVVADGSMMVTSDTTRLFSTGAFGVAMLGAGPKALSLDTTAGMTFAPQNVRWAMEVGVTSMGSAIVVVFPNSGFSGMPFLQVSVYTQPTDLVAGPSRVFKLHVLTASGFSGQIVDSTNNVQRDDSAVMWQSVGTRAL